MGMGSSRTVAQSMVMPTSGPITPGAVGSTLNTAAARNSDPRIRGTVRYPRTAFDRSPDKARARVSVNNENRPDLKGRGPIAGPLTFPIFPARQSMMVAAAYEAANRARMGAAKGTY